MHEYSNILGYLDLDGCSLFDLLPSSFKVNNISYLKYIYLRIPNLVFVGCVF